MLGKVGLKERPFGLTVWKFQSVVSGVIVLGPEAVRGHYREGVVEQSCLPCRKREEEEEG